MKKFLLALLIFAGFLSANAQQRVLWFNEIVPDPNNPKVEYIEFYNTSRTAVPLDCYIVVSYFNNSSGQGVYVYNFPSNATIPGLGFYLISSGGSATAPQSPVVYKTGSYQPTDPTTFSNWNTVGTGGSIAQYNYNTTTKTWSTAQNVPGNFDNFMDISNGNDASLLLYQINSNGTTTLVNGLFGNSGAVVPSNVTSLKPNPNIPPGSTCAAGFSTVSISFAGITANNTDVFQVQSATGNNNGYAKIGNGICGNWIKIQNKGEFTPGTSNPALLGTPTAVLTTQQTISCNNQLQFEITNGASNLFPATVSVYYDNGTTSGTLDVNDTPIPSLTTTINSTDLNKWFTVTIPDPTQPILLVYQTAQGCYSSVVTPTKSSGTLNTTQKNVCGNFIDYTITGTTNGSPGYVLPITVQLFVDANSNGQLDNGEAIGTSQTITSFSATTQRITIPSANKNQVVSISYTSATSCYSAIASPTQSTGALTTTQTSYCGQQVDFTIPSSSGDATTYAFPVTVKVYYDNNNNGTYEPGTDIQAGTTSYTVSSASSTVRSFTSLDPTKQLLLVYTAAQDCFSKTVNSFTAATGGITTTQKSYCNKRIDFQVTGGTGDANAIAASALLPVTVEIHYDLNGDGVVNSGDAGETAVQDSKSVTSFSTTTYQLTVPDSIQNVLIVYKTPYSCYGSTVKASSVAATGGITTTQKSYCNKRIDFQVTGGTGDANANAGIFLLPVIAEVHYDLNGDGVISGSSELTVRDKQTVTSFSTTTYSLTVPDSTKKVLIVYNTPYNCYGSTAQPAVGTGGLTTTQTNFCNKRIDYQITGGTGDAAADANNLLLPVVAEIHYDLNNNGAVDDNEPVVVSQVINSFSTTTNSFVVPDPTQTVLLVYNTPFNCFGTTLAPNPVNRGAVTIEVGGSIQCAQAQGDVAKANYFINNSTTKTAAYPLQLQVYEDVNKDGKINNNEAVIGTQSIDNAPASGDPNTIYQAYLNDRSSYIVVTAISTQGCSAVATPFDNSCAPLPVTFKSFTAVRNKGVVSLKWETAIEQNNKGFYVQRNVNGEWKNIALVCCRGEGGTSSSTLSYAYNDANTNKGITQYRLQQIDNDGKVKYSDIRSVKGQEQHAGVIVFPNPSTDGKVNVVFDSQSVRDVIVSDVAGRIIKQYKEVTDNDLVIEKLTGGFYTIKVTDHVSGQTTVQKVVVK